MNPLKEVFALGQTISWIETQNTIALLRPVTGSTSRGAPGPTAGLAHLLRFREVRLTAPKFLGQELVFRHIDACPDEHLASPAAGRRCADAPYMTNRSVGTHNPFREVESTTFCKHLLNSFRDELAIVGVDQLQNQIKSGL